MGRGTRVLLAACLVVTGCSVPSTGAGSGRPGSTAPGPTTPAAATATVSGTPTATVNGPTGSASPSTLRGLCASALPDRTLLGWGEGTVGDFHAYNYGPQNHKPPLAKAFPGAADDVAGAWCATRAAKQATAWWAVVWQRTPRRAITVVGPGEGRSLGRVSGPPVVP